MTSFLLNLAVHWKEAIYYIHLHDGTAEPFRVAPPEAVAYFIELPLPAFGCDTSGVAQFGTAI